MTFEQAKNEVAKRHGFASWNALVTLHCGGQYRDSYVNEAAELYAKREAIRFAAYIANLHVSDRFSLPHAGSGSTVAMRVKTIEELYNTFNNKP